MYNIKNEPESKLGNLMLMYVNCSLLHNCALPGDADNGRGCICMMIHICGNLCVLGSVALFPCESKASLRSKLYFKSICAKKVILCILKWNSITS